MLEGWPGEKLLIKLVETLERGIGAAFRPWQIKREESARIEARRREKLLLEQAEREAAAVRRGEKVLDKDWKLIPAPVPPSTSRALPELRAAPFDEAAQLVSVAAAIPSYTQEAMARELQRAINLRKVAIFAEEEAETLDDKDNVSENDVDPDWFMKWRTFSQDVSRDEMQRLWGRVLAGEVRSPGSYSMHSLDFLSRISNSDADLIAKLAQFRIGKSIFSNSSQPRGNVIHFRELVYLDDINILNGVTTSLGLNWKNDAQTSNTARYVIFDSNGLALVLWSDDKEELVMPVYTITLVGQEIMSLAKVQPNIAYLRDIAKFAAEKGFNRAQLGRWIPNEAGPGGSASNLVDFS